MQQGGDWRIRDATMALVVRTAGEGAPIIKPSARGARLDPTLPFCVRHCAVLSAANGSTDVHHLRLACAAMTLILGGRRTCRRLAYVVTLRTRELGHCASVGRLTERRAAALMRYGIALTGRSRLRAYAFRSVARFLRALLSGRGQRSVTLGASVLSSSRSPCWRAGCRPVARRVDPADALRAE